MTRAEEALAAATTHLKSDFPLPETNDGKVNVNGLCRLLRLTPTVNYAQHFYKHKPLLELINAAAALQGIQPIKARVGDADDELVRRVIDANRRATSEARSAIEERAAHEAVYEEVVRLRRELARVMLERDGARSRLKLFEEGGLPPEA